MKIKANYINITSRSIFPAQITIEGSKIESIERIEEDVPHYILPGFIDSHIHIESSMLLPAEFAKIAVLHGTVATISDPHEIANVMGIEGVEYMIENGKTVPFHFYFGAPSCVPATIFETAGDAIDANGIKQLMNHPDIWYLAEVMNYPAVINNDAEMLLKLQAAKDSGKPIDGHCPAVTGIPLQKYVEAGITTDHECFTYDEGLEKLELGMKVLIREGSAAKNFDVLIHLIKLFPGQIMFCSDDKHPDDLMLGHINQLVKRAIDAGFDLFDVLYAACILPAKHYKLPLGLLNQGDNADFIVLNDLKSFDVLATYINGICVAENGLSNIETADFRIINKFNCSPVFPKQLKVKGKGRVRVIEARNRQLITGSLVEELESRNGELLPSLEKDILKIVVVNRYFDAEPSVAFITNFGLKKGALASCVAHDSHNIVAVGTNDEDLCQAINLIIEHFGGISVAHGENKQALPLPIAGIMTNKPATEVAEAYTLLDQKVKEMGCQLDAPFMTLSFMALLVIPSLKISDKGLFDGEKFRFTNLNI